MTSYSFHGITKSYGMRRVLRGLSGTCTGGTVTAIVGDNGRGKSTLAKIIAGVLRPDVGEIEFCINDQQIDRSRIVGHCGFVAPYLHLYDEFSPMELMRLHARLHGMQHADETAMDVLEQVGLTDRATTRVKTFSSGMRQRVSIALATYHTPSLLVFDEPSLTLDRAGREMVETVIRRFSSQGAIVVIATNDPREQNLCDNELLIP